MGTDLWKRTAGAVRGRYRDSAFATYGSALHTDCRDCSVSDVVVPAQRTGQRGGSGTAERLGRALEPSSIQG